VRDRGASCWWCLGVVILGISGEGPKPRADMTTGRLLRPLWVKYVSSANGKVGFASCNLLLVAPHTFASGTPGHPQTVWPQNFGCGMSRSRGNMINLKLSHIRRYSASASCAPDGPMARGGPDPWTRHFSVSGYGTVSQEWLNSSALAVLGHNKAHETTTRRRPIRVDQQSAYVETQHPTTGIGPRPWLMPGPPPRPGRNLGFTAVLR
jgi:hypothetical protein